MARFSPLRFFTTESFSPFSSFLVVFARFSVFEVFALFRVSKFLNCCKTYFKDASSYVYGIAGDGYLSNPVHDFFYIINLLSQPCTNLH